jgi:hypothetical protein
MGVPKKMAAVVSTVQSINSDWNKVLFLDTDYFNQVAEEVGCPFRLTKNPKSDADLEVHP